MKERKIYDERENERERERENMTEGDGRRLRKRGGVRSSCRNVTTDTNQRQRRADRQVCSLSEKV